MANNRIDSLSPGQRLDRLVATEIMDNTVVDDDIYGPMEMHTNENGINVYYPLRDYSKNILCARLVVAKMIRMDYHDEAAYWHTEDRPEVICKASLRAVLKRKRKEEIAKARANLSVVK